MKAEDLITEHFNDAQSIAREDVAYLMRTYAKHHVSEALYCASLDADTVSVKHTGCMECGRSDEEIDREKILSAYPKSLIE